MFTNSKNASNATQPPEWTTPGLICSFRWKAYSFHRKAAAPRIAARKPPGMVNGTAPLDGADVVCETVAADWEELAEPEDTLALLTLVDAELEDADVKDVTLVDAELADVELAEEPVEEPEAEAEALPVFDAIKPVWVPVAPWMAKGGEKL